MIYDNNNGGEYAKYFIQQLGSLQIWAHLSLKSSINSLQSALWIDGDVCPGAFQMNTAWHCAPAPRDPIFTEHTHDYEELIGFYGSDPEDPTSTELSSLFQR